MKHKLSLKFILLYVAIAIASFVFISTFGSRLAENWIIRSSSLRMYDCAAQLADKYKSKSIATKNSSDYSALEVAAAGSGFSVQIISATGTVYLDTNEEYYEGYGKKIEGFDPSVFNSGYYMINNFFGTSDSDLLSVIVPITSNLTVRGYVALHMPMTEVYAERESLLAIFHTVEVAILLITLSLLVMIHFWVFKPVNTIISGARKIAAGNYKEKIELKQKDEMGYLADTLNYMSKELSESSENQRKLISNVSHDFRSPLTSIKGYAEAMRDGIIPYEMKDKYLGIILSETNRLTKLTQEMLSLDNIDNRVRKVNYSDFNINKLIKDTALSFELECTKKNITFNLALEGNTLNVNGDYGKIQQVMYNLIDNALKFSKNDSSIDIETSSKNKKAYISVKDHGVGIESNELPKIWNRFYKADSSRGKDRTGSGLGLSIVREIIRSHDQKITVVSTVGAGTEFTFTLDMSENADED